MGSEKVYCLYTHENVDIFGCPLTIFTNSCVYLGLYNNGYFYISINMYILNLEKLFKLWKGHGTDIALNYDIINFENNM